MFIYTLVLLGVSKQPNQDVVQPTLHPNWYRDSDSDSLGDRVGSCSNRGAWRGAAARAAWYSRGLGFDLRHLAAAAPAEDLRRSGSFLRLPCNGDFFPRTEYEFVQAVRAVARRMGAANDRRRRLGFLFEAQSRARPADLHASHDRTGAQPAGALAWQEPRSRAVTEHYRRKHEEVVLELKSEHGIHFFGIVIWPLEIMARAAISASRRRMPTWARGS